ncbi:MAG TPA: acetate--CoA ligase family protein [Gaiellaceae bacterium]|jgi:acyl-CoA synthetase (NDP forming)
MTVSVAPGPSRDARVGLDRLRSLFAARSVAIVGASDNSRWSFTTFTTATRYGFPGELFLVNRSGAPAHGRPTATSCAAIGEHVDVAVLLVGAASLPDALRDVADAGIRGVVALASGFGETGAEGHAAQAELVALAQKLDVVFLGPNCLGFLNLVDRCCAWASPLPVPDATPGPIALVSQSGAVAMQLGRFAAKQGVHFSHVVSTGNQAMIDTLDAARALVDDERVACVAMFVEAIGDAARFDDLAARAAELGKPIVMMKVGRSELAAEIIASHTGSLAGDDAVIDVALRQAGVIRVDSLEELVATAGLVTRMGAVGAGKLGVVSISGGACDIVVDAASAAGVPLAVFTDETRARLRETGSAYGAAHNPLDVTGAAVGGPELMTNAVAAVAADPDVAVVCVVDVLPDGDVLTEPNGRLRVLGPALAALGKPCVVLNQVSQDMPAGLRAEVSELGLEPWIAGLDLGIRSIGNVMRWSAWRPRVHAVPEPPLAIDPSALSEAAALALLADHGIPTVPTRLVHSADEAVAAARELGHPVVVKVVSPQIIHKSDIGGVALGLADDDAVRDAYTRVTAAGEAVDGAVVDGALVAPFRRGGVELIAGVVRDPQWGPTIAVGLGGIWVNALNDSSLRRLPVDEDEVGAMLAELRGAAVLAGGRGGSSSDVGQIAAVVVALGRLALRLGPRLESIEINPLRVDGSTVEALDAVVTWS